MRWLLVLLALGCRAEPKQTGGIDGLASHLSSLAGADQATRDAAVGRWMIDRATWERTVVPTYYELWLPYTRAFADSRAGLVDTLATKGAITVRRHYAGDPKLTNAQGRLRWAFPVQYPSLVAELDGKPIDTVFVWDGTEWRAVAGLDDVIHRRITERSVNCATALRSAGPLSHCTEVGAAVVDAMLRKDDDAFSRMCALAERQCGNESP